MAITLLIICFIAVFLNTGILLSFATGLKETFVCSALIFSFLIVFVTECLSVFNLLIYNYLFLTWGLIAMFNMWYLFTKKIQVQAFIKIIKSRAGLIIAGLDGFQKILLSAVIIILLLVFVQGIIYPPNNWDSMIYHMARVASWVSHKSVADYPTPVFYQLYQPPFAEFSILNFDMLGRSDIFSNSVQFCFLLFSLVVIVSLVKTLGLGRSYQIIAFVVGATIPEVVLQASSTQNDIVVSFFILAGYYFAFKIIKGEPGFKNFLFLGLASGLAFFTKATAYIYLAPLLPIFGIWIIIALVKTKNIKPLYYSLMVLLIAGSINAMHYYCNYQLTTNILGARTTDLNGGVNEKMSPILLLSSIEKNAGLQIGVLGSVKPAEFANKVLYKLNAVEGVDINNPATSFAGAKYSVPIGKANHEDYAANLLHFVFAIAAFILVCVYWIKNKPSLLVKLLLLSVFLQVILFCAYLKWQPWGSRLQVPVFMMSVVLICYAASIYNGFKKQLNPLMAVLLLYAFMLVFRNATRPLLSSEIKENRYEKYFENRPYLYPEYQSVVVSIHRLNYKNIGLITGANDWIYSLFTNCFSQQLNPVYLDVKNISNTIPNTINTVDCIVSTNVNQAFIDYNGKRFYEQGGKNVYIYFYISH
jgi:4-amino-4-deoxy-L-arabinose transferase-like glycosyltransferase